MLCGVRIVLALIGAYFVSIALGAVGIALGVAGYYLEAQNLGRMAIVLGVVSIFVGLFVGQGVIPGSYDDAVNGIKETIREAVETGFSFLEYHVYLVALAGLATFYGLDRAAKVSRRRRQNAGKEDYTEAGVFWLHVASFSAYNALIGYLLLHRETPGFPSLFLFAFALGLHFVVNDFGLRKDYKGLYDEVGRWILAAAILVGWVTGLFSEISEAALTVLFAFLAGGVVLNVLKEEIPEERESSYGAFALGAAFYAAILLIAF